MKHSTYQSFLESIQEIKTSLDFQERTVMTNDGHLCTVISYKNLANPDKLIRFIEDNPLKKISIETVQKLGPIITGEPHYILKHLNLGGIGILTPNLEPFAVIMESGIKRKPQEPKIERSIRGPSDALVEDIFDNLSMIRRKLPDHHLRADRMQLGRRTANKIAICYLADVANPDLVLEVKERIGKIDIDGVPDAGIVEEFIRDRKFTPMPLTQSTERPDKIVGFLLEGRIAIFVDQSPRAILLPVSLNDLYMATDDYYFDFWSGTLMRVVRFLGSLIAVGLSGLYIAMVGSSPHLIPISLGLEIAGMRVGMPLPLPFEVFLSELLVELFREAGLRLPNGIALTVGTATGVTLGYAMVMSGFASIPTIIVVGISAIASFSTPNFSVGFAWRTLKYILILAASVLGYYGFILGSLFIMGHIASLTSFGTPYTTPWGPWVGSDAKDSIIRFPHWLLTKRPKAFKPQELKRRKDSR